MSWTLVLSLAGGAFAFKAAGFFVLAGRRMPAPVERCLALIPAAVVMALVVKDTFTSGRSLVLDARVLGVATAVLLVRRRAPFVVVLVTAAAVTVLARRVAP